MSDFYIDVIERTAARSGYTFAELEYHFEQLVTADEISVSDFVWLAMEGML